MTATHTPQFKIYAQILSDPVPGLTQLAANHDSQHLLFLGPYTGDFDTIYKGLVALFGADRIHQVYEDY